MIASDSVKPTSDEPGRLGCSVCTFDKQAHNTVGEEDKVIPGALSISYLHAATISVELAPLQFADYWSNALRLNNLGMERQELRCELHDVHLRVQA